MATKPKGKGKGKKTAATAVADPTAPVAQGAQLAPNRSATVAALMARHPGRIFYGGDYTMPWMIRRLPTGVTELDIALQGGLPAGGFTMIRGKEGIGKNWLCNQIIANQQRIFGDECKIAVVSCEMVYDKQFAHSCGVKIPMSYDEIDSLVRAAKAEGMTIDPAYLESLCEEIGEFAVVLPNTAEINLNIAVDLIRSREFNVVMIDSFGSMMSEDEEEKTFTDNLKMGGTSLLNTSFSRKMNSALGPDENGKPNLTCVLGINQVRDNLHRTNPNSPMTTESGGWALKHARWVTIELSNRARIRQGKEGPVIGKEVAWEIMKQKAGGHEGGSGTYEYIWATAGINRPKEILRAAVANQVVEKDGATYSYQGAVLAVGIDKAAKVIEDCDMLGEIEQATLRAAGIRCNYR